MKPHQELNVVELIVVEGLKVEWMAVVLSARVGESLVVYSRNNVMIVEQGMMGDLIVEVGEGLVVDSWTELEMLAGEGLVVDSWIELEVLAEMMMVNILMMGSMRVDRWASMTKCLMVSVREDCLMSTMKCMMTSASFDRLVVAVVVREDLLGDLVQFCVMSLDLLVIL